MKNIWKSLPGWAKGAIVLFVIILVLIIIRNIGKWIQLLKAKRDQAVLETAVFATGEQPTYSLANYQGFANTLYYAMQSDWYNPFDWGTDEAAINGVFDKMMNTRDILELVKAFGARDGYTLEQWLRGDLSSSAIASINQKLSSKGINYQF